jgi:thioredoxin-disulfide reductase
MVRKVLISALALVLVYSCIASAQDKEPEKMRLKELKKILADRGVKCVACLEKEDFVKRVKETAHLKVLPPAGPPPHYVEGKVKEIVDHREFTQGLAKHRDDTGLPVIVDFFSHSCGPCIQIAPLFADLAQEFRGRAVFWKIDVNRNYQTSQSANVRSMPTFQFFLDNKKKHQFSGGDPQGMRSWTERLVQQSENAGTYVGMEVTEEAVKDFYEQNKDQVGAKADPSAVAAKYQGKTALLVKHMRAKYGSAPKPTKKLYRQEEKPLSKSTKTEQKCQAPDMSEVMNSASSEELEAELERRKAMDEPDPSMMFEEADLTATEAEKVVIVGGGPAGLAAAVYAARAGLNPVVVAPAVGGQLLGKGVDVENYPGVMGKEATGRGLVMLMRKQTYRFETRLVDDSIISADLSKKPLELRLNNTEGVLRTHALIIATGADSRWLGVKGEHDFRGGGVSSCATCDGFLFRDQHVVVVGGGDTAMEDALVLARTSATVTLIHRRDTFRASHVLASRVLGHPKIAVRWNCTVEEFGGDKDEEGNPQLTHVVIKNKISGQTEKIDVGAAFVAVGHTPNTKVFGDSLDMDQQGYLQVAAGSTKTTVDGVFAAGDVSDKVYRQAVTSAGTGAMAALDAERWLSEQGLGVE